MRRSDLLDLLLCEDCCVEKEEVFYTGPFQRELLQSALSIWRRLCLDNKEEEKTTWKVSGIEPTTPGLASSKRWMRLVTVTRDAVDARALSPGQVMNIIINRNVDKVKIHTNVHNL